MTPSPTVRLPVPTRAGNFVATYSPRGLVALAFPGRPREPADRQGLSPEIRRWHALTIYAVRSLLNGRAPRRLPPLDLDGGTAFQRAVWARLRRIPAGETRTYGEVARALRRPGAARAVGSACGANPIPLLIPCHRVLAAGGKLGGFSAGLGWKRHLLATEGALPGDTHRAGGNHRSLTKPAAVGLCPLSGQRPKPADSWRWPACIGRARRRSDRRSSSG